jgi:hypothetical protein
MRRGFVCFFLLLSLTCFAQEGTRGPSTRAERDRAVKVAHQLEADPLSPALRANRDWLLGWIQAVPDITISVCLDPAEGAGRYRYSHELLMQKMFSSAAYVIETSARSRDDISVEEAGVEGALKAYEAIIKKDSQAHSAYWDRLLQKRAKGTLHDYVANYMESSCGSEQTPT